MRKRIGITFLMVLVLCTTGCKKQNLEEIKSNLRKMDNLVVMETYSHNIADFDKPAEKGFWHLLDKDMKLWVEYIGTAKIGIELKDVKIEEKSGKLYVFVPKPKVLSTNIGELTEDSFYSSKDGLFNKNKLTAEDSQEALVVAQNKMRAVLESDRTLLISAQEKAKFLLKEIFELGGTTDIEWELEEIE